jgi:pseudouridine synthase
MVLSSDGDLIQSLTHPRYQKVKIYQIRLNHPLQPLHQQMISDLGIDLPDGKSQFELQELSPEQIPEKPSTEPLQSTRPQLHPKGLRARQIALGEAEALAKPSVLSGEVVGSKRLDSGGVPRRHWQVTMREGRNRQIRRTFAALGYKVEQLHRITLGPYTLKNLKPGQFRETK